MILATTRQELHAALEAARQDGRRVGLVPTMGYLHQGHLSLVTLARGEADFLTASIFVNPLQFSPEEDLDRYPRDLERDLSVLEGEGVDLVFHPSVQEMYPGGEPGITVDPGSLGSLLCGAHRPGHFRGVLTVVARLFGLFRPQLAAFGQKDYQQAVLIQAMVRDLDLGVKVLLGPIVREDDGLALSSRNVFLSPLERESGLGLRRGLLAVDAAVRGGEGSPERLYRRFDEVAGRHPGLRIQYRTLVHPETLEEVGEVKEGHILAVAGHCGRTRLIDNQVLGG